MSYLKPRAGKATVEDLGYELRVTIPSKRSLFVILFLSAWLGGWWLGEIEVIKMLAKELGSRNLFLILWLCGWTVGGAFAFLSLIWNIDGKEVMTLSPEALQIAYRSLGLGPYRKYRLYEASNFRLNPDRIPRSEGGFWGVGTGALSFDYGKKTIQFAQGIVESEAAELLEKLKKRGYVRETRQEHQVKL